MPTSPVKTRIPLTSFGHLITEVKGFGENAVIAEVRVVLFQRGHAGIGFSNTFSADLLCCMPRLPHFEVTELCLHHHLPTRIFIIRQLFGIEAPASVELTGWRKHFNSYTIQGRRNYVLVTYGILAGAAAAYFIHRQSKENTTNVQLHAMET